MGNPVPTSNSSKVRSIQRVVRKVGLYEANSDFAFWQTQSFEARVAALEDIRQSYNEWNYGPESRLQRVLTIVKRK